MKDIHGCILSSYLLLFAAIFNHSRKKITLIKFAILTEPRVLHTLRHSYVIRDHVSARSRTRQRQAQHGYQIIAISMPLEKNSAENLMVP